MNQVLYRLGLRTLAPAMIIALAIGAIGPATPAVHAEPKQPDTSRMTIPCRIDDFWLVDEGTIVIAINDDGTTTTYKCVGGEWVEIGRRAPGPARATRLGVLPWSRVLSVR
jgi:hypothetical protein